MAGLHLGLPEAALEHEAGLITKSEVRAVVLAKLQLLPGQVLWDVGAGCGSVGLEASLLLPGGRIIAVEQQPERAGQIMANKSRFGVSNLEVVSGTAPDCLERFAAAGPGVYRGRRQQVEPDFRSGAGAGATPGPGGGNGHFVDNLTHCQ